MPRKQGLDWAKGFPEHFLSVLNPQAVGGLCRQLGIRPRGKPKLSVFQLLMVLVGHALAPSGDLAMHAHGLSRRRISNAALSKRRRRLPWQIFERMMDWVLGPVADAQKHPTAFWRGYRLVGVDGTMFSAPNTPGILRWLKKAASRRLGSAFAKLRVVILVELGTHHPMAAVIDTAQHGELTLAYRLASYAGTTPRVSSSGDKTRYGRLRPDVNHYLKWALVEAANSVAVNHTRCPQRHASQLYRRLRARKGHAKAVGAVARHLAEAAFLVLSRKEAYRDPVLHQGQSRAV